MRRLRIYIGAVAILALTAPAWASKQPSESGYAETTLLAATTITTAVTASTSTAVTGLYGVKSAVVQYVFTYGSAGTSAKAWVQTSCDGGTTWIDIANLAATTASETRVYNLSAATPVTTIYTPTDGTLTDDTAKDGILCSQYRVKYTTTGTYADSTTLAVTLATKGG